MEMDYNKTYNRILTDEEFMEIKQHGSSDYPFQYYYDNLELFDFHCIDWQDIFLIDQAVLRCNKFRHTYKVRNDTT